MQRQGVNRDQLSQRCEFGSAGRAPRPHSRPAARAFRKKCAVRRPRPDGALVVRAQAEARSARTAEERQAGRATYRPSSYTELIEDAMLSVRYALEDGLTRLEVEFPAVSNVDGYKGSSDLFIDTNIQLACVAARKLHNETGKRVHVVVPDETEYRRARDLFKSALALSDGVSLGHLWEGRETLLTGIAALFAGAPGSAPPGVGPSEMAAKADVFIAVNASTVELADLEKYVDSVVKERAVVTWNMELDTLRADLGTGEIVVFSPLFFMVSFLTLSSVSSVFNSSGRPN
jgi:hypothetical protein